MQLIFGIAIGLLLTPLVRGIRVWFWLSGETTPIKIGKERREMLIAADHMKDER